MYLFLRSFNVINSFFCQKNFFGSLGIEVLLHLLFYLQLKYLFFPLFPFSEQAQAEIFGIVAIGDEREIVQVIEVRELLGIIFLENIKEVEVEIHVRFIKIYYYQS